MPDTRLSSKVKSKSRSQAIKECDLACGAYVKDRDCPDGWGHCISCGKPIRRNECEAGHYVPRANMATRWDEDNIHAQCITCNNEKMGNIPNYTKGLMKKYGGTGIIDRLFAEGKQTAHFSTREIEEKTKHFKQKRREL